MYMQMQLLQQKLYEGTDADTDAYEHSLGKRKQAASVVGLTVIISVIGVFFLPSYMGDTATTWIVLLAAVIICGSVLFYMLRYAAHLNAHGKIIRADWLGFKLYLQTAERYRLQNLTPATFEKFLPYAMIFGVEKKWAKAFDSLNVPQPSWYVGTYAGVSSGRGAASFSPSGFATGFSASFSSSFSSSGASGASGGGGGAGGGGGSGGGGAS